MRSGTRPHACWVVAHVGPGANERSNGFVLGAISSVAAIVASLSVAVARRTIGPAFEIAITAPALAVAGAKRTITARPTTITIKFAWPIAIAWTVRATAFRAAVAAATKTARTVRAAGRRAHRAVLVHEFRHLLELFTTQRIILIRIE